MSRRPPSFPACILSGLALTVIAPTSAHAQAVGPSEATPLQTITIEGKRDEPIIGQKPDAEGIADYRVTRGTTGAKAEMANSDIPQAVVTVPQRILEEQQIQTLNDALRNVSGAISTQSALQNSQWPILRGFESRNFYKDGMRDDLFDRSYWLGNVERIEVLKGPASVLYGDGSLGGIINVVTKKPRQETAASAGLWGGSYETGGGSADLSARLTDDGRALARVIVDGERQNAFVDHFNSNTQHASAIIQAQPGDATALTLGAEYRRRVQNGNDWGVPGYAMSYGLPRSRSYDADWSTRTDIGDNVNSRVSHDIDGNWKINSGLLVNQYTFDQTLTSSSFSAINNTITRTPNKTWSATNEVVSDTNVEGSIPVAGINNKVVAGAEVSYGLVHREVFGGTATSTNLYRPVTSYAQPTWTKTDDQDFTTSRKGIYIQDLVEITPQLKVMGGLRYDWVYRATENTLRANTATTTYNGTTHNNKASKRLGATFEAIPGVTLYGGWMRSFVPPGNSVAVGSVPNAPPEMGEQYESGVKLDLSDRVTTTVAVYQLTRQNVRTTNAVTNETTITGEQQSKGVELDATWTVAQGWNLLLNYAYTDAAVTKDARYVVGSQLANVPTHSGRLWSMYEFQDGPMAGLGFGGGVTYVGERAANVRVSRVYYMPAYATVDLAAYYQASDHVKLSLNANNLLDKRYYIASPNGSSLTADNPMVTFGEPFSLMGRIQVSY